MVSLKQNPFQISILIVIGIIVTLGVVGAILSSDKAVPIIGFCSVVCVGLLNLLKGDAAEQKVDDAAKKVELVRLNLQSANNETTLHHNDEDGRLKRIEETNEKVHTLVNSNMGVQLRLNAAVTKRLADITKDKDDIAAMDLAKIMLVEHEKKQVMVDKGV